MYTVQGGFERETGVVSLFVRERCESILKIATVCSAHTNKRLMLLLDSGGRF